MFRRKQVIEQHRPIAECLFSSLEVQLCGGSKERRCGKQDNGLFIDPTDEQHFPFVGAERAVHFRQYLEYREQPLLGFFK